MFDFVSRKKKDVKTFDPAAEITSLSTFSPPSTLVYMANPRGDGDALEDLGKAFFLRRDKKLYTEGSNLCITAPDNLKSSGADQSLTDKTIKLQFFSRLIPHRMECKVVGRFRLLPEIVETLDFNAKFACRLLPITRIATQKKRK